MKFPSISLSREWKELKKFESLEPSVRSIVFYAENAGSIVHLQPLIDELTESLINSMTAAAKKNKLKIAGISDYTADEVEIEIRLARGIQAEDTIDALYAFTDCESSISTDVLVIRDRHPCILPVTEVIKHNTNHLLEVLGAELKVEEKQLRKRLHAKTLEQLFIEERIYKHIEEVKDQKLINDAVRQGFKPFETKVKELTDDDIENLLKVPIRRVS